MAEQSPHPTGGGNAPQGPEYESGGVRVGVVWWFTFGLALGTLGVLVGIWWMEAWLVPGSGPPKLETLHVDQPLQPRPGRPVLPWEDLRQLRRAQADMLQSYGPIAGDRAHMHIPINRAMDLLLQSGRLNQSWQLPTTLPYRTETQPSPWIKPSVRNRT